ncbi:MAG: site-specific integrase [Pseudomonadota bacterium]
MIDDPYRRIERETATWPPEQAARWIEAFGLPCSWAEPTRRSRAYTWTKYLAHCRAHGLPLALTVVGVHRFAVTCSSNGVSIRTFGTYAWDLHAVASIVDASSPALPWLLARAQALVPHARRAPRHKEGVLARAAGADDYYAATVRLMAEAAAALEGVDLGSFVGAMSLPARVRGPLVRYRGALLLALALACPERRRALLELEVGDVDLERGEVRYRGATTKTGHGHPAPLPPLLVEALARWLAWRAALRPAHRRFWIHVAPRHVGDPAGTDVVYRDIRRTTAALGGEALWPHLTRDLAADLARSGLPEIADLASQVLDHRDSRTTSVYGTRARQTLAHRRAQTVIGDAIAAAGKRGRAKAKGKGRAVLGRRYRRRRRRDG